MGTNTGCQAAYSHHTRGEIRLMAVCPTAHPTYTHSTLRHDETPRYIQPAASFWAKLQSHENKLGTNASMTKREGNGDAGSS